jgi:transcriptional regulator with XRE-family HTH domain
MHSQRRRAMNTISRANELAEFQAGIKKVDLKQDDEFQKLISGAQHVLEMTDGELADALSVSRPTINRWVNGRNLPYNGLRKAVFTWIDRQLTKKIRTRESTGAASTATEGSFSSYERAGYPMAAKGR